jgi:small subunit ribosomal protein S34
MVRRYFIKIETKFQNRKYEPAVPYIDEDRKCRVWVEKVFRGKLYDKQFVIERTSYKSDYILLSKEQEKSYCNSNPIKVKLIDPYMDLPPLLKELVSKETKQKNPQMKVRLNNSLFTNSRIAKEGEKPDVRLKMGLGDPVESCKHLYDNCKI